MNGHPEIIEVLNDVLTAELTAINQYFAHSEICENWGYERLHQAIREHCHRRDEARGGTYRSCTLSQCDAQHGTLF